MNAGPAPPDLQLGASDAPSIPLLDVHSLRLQACHPTSHHSMASPSATEAALFPSEFVRQKLERAVALPAEERGYDAQALLNMHLLLLPVHCAADAAHALC